MLGIIQDALAKRDGGAALGDKNIVTLFLGAKKQGGADEGQDLDKLYEQSRLFLRDAVVNFMIAGHDPIAQALCWLILRLNQHPELETKFVKSSQRSSRLFRPLSTARTPVLMERTTKWCPLWPRYRRCRSWTL